MFKIRFNDLIFLSNSRAIKKKNVIFLFYGIGGASNDFKSILSLFSVKNQILIPELPGHNGHYFRNCNALLFFAKSIFLFIKKKKIESVFFFSHSIGGIIPILLVKNFLKKKIKIKNFVNYEGNLCDHDTELVTKRTASYKKSEFNKKYKKLIEKCEQSSIEYLNFWADSMKKTLPEAFFQLSKDSVAYSKGRYLLSFFRIFFDKKVYVYGANSNICLPKFSFGSVRFKIKGCGHFSHFENVYEFNKMFTFLLLKS